MMVHLPEVLIFHVKRFEIMGRKISKSMEYPGKLDVREYMDKDMQNKISSSYNLIGIAEHVGGSELRGHYIAHTLRDGNWYKFDDEDFRHVSEK